jgi:hypothetical protein
LYDAHKQLDPQAWPKLDESERIDLGIDDGHGSNPEVEDQVRERPLCPTKRPN